MSLETKQVELKSVGLVLTLSQSNFKISRIKDNLEKEAKNMRLKMETGEIPMDEDYLLMAEIFYPVIAACVVSGNCPTVQQCVEDIADDEINQWYTEARELNKGWFVMLDKIAELASQEEEEKSDAALKKEMTNSEMKPEGKTLEKSSTS